MLPTRLFARFIYDAITGVGDQILVLKVEDFHLANVGKYGS